MKRFMVLMAGIAVIFMFAPGTASAECDRCGDLTGDGEVDISDLVAFIDWVFPPFVTPACPCAADVNCDNAITVNLNNIYDPNTDLGYFINWMFFGGPAPCDPDDDSEQECDPCG